MVSMNENVQKKLVEPLRHVPTQTDKRRTKIDFSICGLTQTDRNEYPDANGSKRIQIMSEMRQSARDAVSLSHRFIVSYIVGAKEKHEL
jgi:hypothetical protein